MQLGDVEHRQLEQLRRTVSREATGYAEAAAQQFDTTIRAAREDAARRLGRELDLAVERFAREAEGVLAERVEHVGDAAVKRVEKRLQGVGGGLDRQRDEAMRTIELSAHEIEAELRRRLDGHRRRGRGGADRDGSAAARSAAPPRRAGRPGVAVTRPSGGAATCQKA